MNTLRFTTTKPMAMMGIFHSKEDHKPLSVPVNAGEFIKDVVKGKGAYIHGEAEHLAGFDIITWIDGNLGQLDRPIEEQDILMILPGGEYPCKAEYCTEFGAQDKYLITLKTEPKVFK